MTTINQITRADVADFQSLSETQSSKFNTANFYQRIATKSAIYPGRGTPLGLAYVALKMNGEAGEFAEHVGKAMRDDHLTVSFEEPATGDQPMQHYFGYTELEPDRRTLLIKEIGDVAWYLSAACNELGISLSEALAQNLEKLCDRGERNVLQGSGDDR